MNVHFPILFLGILFLISCEDMFNGGEIIISDYESELNVYGFVSFDDQKSSFVHVHRTLGLDENPANSLSYFVHDAEVFITDPLGMHNEFSEVDNVYYDTFDVFDPQYDTDYMLHITALNGLSLTGTMHTPSQPILLSPLSTDVIYPGSFFTIQWEAYENAIVRVQVKRSGNEGCYINKFEYFENGETEWTTKIFSCYDDEGGNNNPNNLFIELTFMDINYYDYFIKSDENEFLNFLMGSSGSTQHAFGIEGGLGVFGTYATATVILSFDP